MYLFIYLIFQVEQPSRRFRKREKVMFYGKKMLRKVYLSPEYTFVCIVCNNSDRKESKFKNTSTFLKRQWKNYETIPFVGEKLHKEYDT